MNKNTLIILSFSLLALTACQQPANPRESADEKDVDQSTVSSQLSLEIKPSANPDESISTQSSVIPTQSTPTTVTVPGQPASTTSVTVPEQPLPVDVSYSVTAEGISPTAIVTMVGAKLTISNTLDKQVELYTSGIAGKECPLLGATIEIPGGQSKVFQLDKAFNCTIINQLNTYQNATLQVEPEKKTK